MVKDLFSEPSKKEVDYSFADRAQEKALKILLLSIVGYLILLTLIK